MFILLLLVLEIALIAVGVVADGSFALVLAGLALFTLTAACGLIPGREGHSRGGPRGHQLHRRGGHRHA